MADRIPYLVVGGGVTGLAFAAHADRRCRVLEREGEVGGWCRSVRRDGFVWDYSGHFFHFRRPEIESWLRERLPTPPLEVTKRSAVLSGGRLVDYPFQANIHQLDRDGFLRCLHDLYFAPRADRYPNLRAMFEGEFGRGISERFLVPFNEKLYGVDLETLEADAMGRFFPTPRLDDIVRGFVAPDDRSYNARFLYPREGAGAWADGLAAALPEGTVELGREVVAIDRRDRLATTSDGDRIRYETLVSTAPLPRLLGMCGLDEEAGTFTANRVAVFNLGYDRKGPTEHHWIYVPERRFPFYRVGFYDNVVGGDRMSLYVEVGLPPGREPVDLDALSERVGRGLVDAGIVDDHRLVASHRVVLDPAYCHLTRASITAAERLRDELAADGIRSIGRYGRWTYCSIEDNVHEARGLARELGGG